MDRFRNPNPRGESLVPGGRGGELIGDDNDVEGHSVTDRYKAIEDDDTQGHALRGATEDEDVEGHRLTTKPAKGLTDDDDDVEGHKVSRGLTDDDDVEGHKVSRG